MNDALAESKVRDIVSGVDKNLIISLRADVVWSVILGIVIPLVTYVAFPAFSKMSKQPAPDKLGLAMEALAIGLFFLLKILLDIKAMSLSIKWVWASMACCLPVYFVIYHLIPFNMDWVVMVVYALIFFGSSVAVGVFGMQKILSTRHGSQR